MLQIIFKRLRKSRGSLKMKRWSKRKSWRLNSNVLHQLLQQTVAMVRKIVNRPLGAPSKLIKSLLRTSMIANLWAIEFRRLSTLVRLSSRRISLNSSARWPMPTSYSWRYFSWCQVCRISMGQQPLSCHLCLLLACLWSKTPLRITKGASKIHRRITILSKLHRGVAAKQLLGL